MYLVEVEKKWEKLQDMHSTLSNRVIVKILYRVVTIVPMHTPIQSTLGLHYKPGVNHETCFAILRLFLLPCISVHLRTVSSGKKLQFLLSFMSF